MAQKRAQSKTTRRGKTYWRRALVAQRHSGLTQAEFCRRNDLALSTFQYWRRRLRETEDTTESKASPPASDFVELAVQPTALQAVADSSTSPSFELTFPSGLQLKVPCGVEGRALAEVLWALEVTGSC